MAQGDTYGTILVDLERRVAVDLLPGRSAEGFARWLVEHPGVEIIARYCSEIYAEGARRGAPEAVQVVDRWHLLKNVSDLVERSRVEAMLREEPDLLTAEVRRRLRRDGWSGGKTTAYDLVGAVRPGLNTRLLVRFDWLTGEFC